MLRQPRYSFADARDGAYDPAFLQSECDQAGCAAIARWIQFCSINPHPRPHCGCCPTAVALLLAEHAVDTRLTLRRCKYSRYRRRRQQRHHTSEEQLRSRTLLQVIAEQL